MFQNECLNHPSTSHAPPASHHMWLENHLSTTGKIQCLWHVWSLLLRAYKFRSNLYGKNNSQKHHIQQFHPDCTLIYSNSLLWQWNIPCVLGQNSKASKQRDVFTLQYLFRNTFNSYLQKSWTTRHVQEHCNSWGLWSIHWSTGAADKQYHYHHTLLLYLADGTSLHNNGNYRFILRSPNQKTIMSSW